jgi:hypothetical protein
MPLEEQDRVVTMQTAHHAPQALYYPIHGAKSSRSHSGKSKRRAFGRKHVRVPLDAFCPCMGSDLTRTLMPTPEIRQQDMQDVLSSVSTSC